MSLVFFDLETGGLTDAHPNIQIAAVAVGADFSEEGTFHKLIQFREEDADPEALKMNHYDAQRWDREARPEPEVIRDFGRFLKRFASVEMISKKSGAPYRVARLGGHNVSTFDGPRLRQAFARCSEFMPAHPLMLDTMQLALWHFQTRVDKPGNVKLSEIAKHFGVDTEGAHDALTDVRLCIQIAKAMTSATNEKAA